jgi:DNA-binding response OmpR family regulator
MDKYSYTYIKTVKILCLYLVILGITDFIDFLSMVIKKKQIIYVEDSTTVSMLVKYKLTMEGFDVKIVTNGEFAFEIIKSELPNIVLLDVMLPIKNGFTILKELKGSEETKDIPVIMLTTNSEEDLILKCFEEGASDYITKPFSTPVLVARINKILHK